MQVFCQTSDELGGPFTKKTQLNQQKPAFGAEFREIAPSKAPQPRCGRGIEDDCQDFTPDAAFGWSATVSAGPVAAGGWAEVVENILRLGFANVLRLIPLCGTQPRSYRNAVAAFSPALTRSDYAG